MEPSIFLLSFFLILHRHFSLCAPTLVTVSRDQVSCTMCSSCDNPCQPLPSPPPPSPPPSTGASECPPPPSTTSPPPSSGTYYYSPPPPSETTYTYSSPRSPAYGGDGFYSPPNYWNYPAPPPPDPILPYFPFYYINPPPSASFASRSSVFLEIQPLTFLIFILFCFV